MYNDISNYGSEFIPIKWLALPHCPPGQLIKPGDPTDAGYDLKAASDVLVKPLSELDYEWEKVREIGHEDYDMVDYCHRRVGYHFGIPNETPLSDVLLTFDNLKFENGVMYRKKYKMQLIPTGVKIQPKDMMWCGIYNRSGNPGKYGYSLLNAVGVLDFKYGGELFVSVAPVEGHTFISKGERVAQLIPHKQMRTQLVQVDEEEFTNQRGGFNSTGIM